MSQAMPLVVGVGELLWDLLPEGRQVGGATANFAYHAAAQGAEAYVVSAVGDDPEGLDLLAEIGAKGLSAEYIATLPGQATGTVTVKLAHGMPSYTIHAPVAWDRIPFTDDLEQLAGQADAVCFGTLAQRGKVSAATIQRFLSHVRPDCLKVFDVNLRQKFFNAKVIKASLELCDLLKVSDEELPELARLLDLRGDNDNAMVTKLVREHKLKYAVLTKGQNGSAFFSADGDHFEIPANHFGPKVDTVGCGDSFTATLTTGLLLGFSSEESMLHAAKVAGFVCASQGATPVIMDELKLRR